MHSYALEKTSYQTMHTLTPLEEYWRLDIYFNQGGGGGDQLRGDLYVIGEAWYLKYTTPEGHHKK